MNVLYHNFGRVYKFTTGISEMLIAYLRLDTGAHHDWFNIMTAYRSDINQHNDDQYH